jgi:glycosyltransferase involved in cell wall biosynthesis
VKFGNSSQGDKAMSLTPKDPDPGAGSHETGAATEGTAPSDRPTFTVFTATFNRAHTLHRVFESLKAQTLDDFEWLIVDDGSTDGTDALVRKWIDGAAFPIRYYWQENQGKHVAFNEGVRRARGELFLILDSDDACDPEALETFKKHWEAIPEEERGSFTGVACLSRQPDGTIHGSRFPVEPLDVSSFHVRYRLGVTGEKWGFHRTEVLSRFPFPVIPGETTVPESLVWNRISQQYKTRFINAPLRIYYPTEGSWASSPLSRIRSPVSASLYYLEHAGLLEAESLWNRIRALANYVRFSLHAGVGSREMFRRARQPGAMVLAYPVGLARYIADRPTVYGAGHSRKQPEEGTGPPLC